MAIAWFWPPNGASARTTAMVPYRNGMALPDWSAPTIWPFNIGAGFTSGIVLSSTVPGLGGLCGDGGTGLWALSYAGSFWHVGSGGGVAATGMLPNNDVYIGASSPGGQPYFLSALGNVFTSGGVLFGTWPNPIKSLVSSGSTLATLLPPSGVGTMDANLGTTGLINLPAGITTASCLAFAPGGNLALGGWQASRPLIGMAAGALDPQNPLTMLAVGSGQAITWNVTSVYSENWVPNQTLTGLANLNSMSWRPDGTQILATSATGGVVQCLNYLFGTMSLQQTLTVASATAVMIGSDSLHALVVQSGATQLTSLINSGGAWATSLPVIGASAFTGIAPVSNGAVVTYGSGIAYVTLGTGGWTLSPPVTLPFAPNVITADPFNNVYAAGSGNIASVSGNALTGLGAWNGGTPTAILAHQGRIVVAVPPDGLIYVFGHTAVGGGSGGSQFLTDQSGNVITDQAGQPIQMPSSQPSWSAEYSGALNLGSFVGLGQSSAQLFTFSSGSTIISGFSGQPYVLTPTLAGTAAQWNGTSWTTTTLGIGHVPSACAYDASGNLQLTTIQNTLWSIAPAGNVNSSGSVPQYLGQSQTVPLGPSAILASGGGVYVATSMPGVLIEVI